MVAGQKPSSAAHSRSLSVLIVIACVGARPRTGRRAARVARMCALLHAGLPCDEYAFGDRYYKANFLLDERDQLSEYTDTMEESNADL
jgi:hypothetical protein